MWIEPGENVEKSTDAVEGELRPKRKFRFEEVMELKSKEILKLKPSEIEVVNKNHFDWKKFWKNYQKAHPNEIPRKKENNRKYSLMVF